MPALFTSATERFPRIRYMALGVWLAWSYLMFESEIWLDPSEADSSAPYNVFLFSTIGFVIACAAFVIFSKKAVELFNHRSTLLVIGLVATSASALLYFCGPRYLMQVSFVTAAIFSLFAAFLTGVGTSAISARCMQLFAPFSPKEIFLLGASNILLSGAIYFIAISSPDIVGIIIFFLLPFLAAFLVMDNPEKNDLPTHVATPTNKEVETLTTRFAVVIAAMTFAVSILRFEAGYYMDPAGAAESTNIAVLIRIGLALLAVVGILKMSELFPLSRLFYTALLLVAFVPCAASLFLLDTGVVSCIINGFYTAFSTFIWCLLAQFGFHSPAAAIKIYGKGWGALTFGGLMGSLVGFAIAYLQPSYMVVVLISFVVLIICIFVSIFVFSMRDFDQLIAMCNITAKTEDGQNDYETDDLSDALPQNSRVTFSAALDAFSEEHSLSAREKDVTAAMLRGEKPSTIAEKMYLSINTVRRHIQNIYVKTDSHARDDLYEKFYNETGCFPLPHAGEKADNKTERQ